MIDRLGHLVEELKERRVVRFIGGYLVGAWIVAQVAGFFVEQGYVGRTLLDVTLYLTVVFFFLTLVLVWHHGERGHQRVQRVEGVLIAALLIVAAVGSGWIATRDRGTGSAAGSVDPGASSVAVLPFQNQILSPEYEWLDRGIADLLATDLSQFDTLRVVSGQRLFDVMRQLGVESGRTVPEEMQTVVAERAGARFMLTGSIVGSPDNLQVIATLSDIRTGDIRASSRARGSDVFALVDEVSAAISSDLLGRTISPVEKAPVTQLTTNSLEAYREFDAGRDAFWQFLLVEARERFERAIELDPTFALAHFQLAILSFRSGGVRAGLTHLQEASRHLEGASERDRLAVGGFVDLLSGRTSEGDRKIRELLRKYPDEKDARILYAGFLSGPPLNRPEEVEPLLREILELDPFYSEAYNLLAYRSARRGDFEAADSLIQRYVELEPRRPNPLDSRGEILEMAGRLDDAREAFRAALELREDFAISLGHLIRTYVREGRYEDAREELLAYRASESADTRVWAWLLASDTYMWEGRIAPALAVMDSLVEVSAATRPDLHAQALDGYARTLVLLERYDEAADVARRLEAVRGPDGVTAVVRMHRLGSAGDIEEMEAIRGRSLAEAQAAGSPRTFIDAVEAGTAVLIAYYRGEPTRVVEIVREFNEDAPFQLTQLGYPGIRSALEIGDAEAAREGVAGMMFQALGAEGVEYRIPPLESRYRAYFRGRIAELEGDTASAASLYEGLVEDWEPGLDDVPLFRDVPARLDALGAGN